jgi:hypothetical protein
MSARHESVASQNFCDFFKKNQQKCIFLFYKVQSLQKKWFFSGGNAQRGAHMAQNLQK